MHPRMTGMHNYIPSDNGRTEAINFPISFDTVI